MGNQFKSEGFFGTFLTPENMFLCELPVDP